MSQSLPSVRLLDIAFGSLLVADSLLQFVRPCILGGKTQDLHHWTCTNLQLVLCHLEWHVEYLSFSGSHILFF